MPLIQLLKRVGGRPAGSIINVTQGAADLLETEASAVILTPNVSNESEPDDE